MSSSSDVVDSPCTMIQEKIKSVFNNVSNNYLNGDGFIQFWAPVEQTIAGVQRRVLSTLNQPFAHKDEDFQTYRLSCLKYLFSIDDHLRIDQLVEEGDYEMAIITNCSYGPAPTFMERMPAVVNLMLKSCNTPLVTPALHCGLIVSVFLPIIDRQRSSSCVGVVECSVKRSGLVPFFKYLITALERVGLATHRVQKTRPYKNIWGPKHTYDEIEKALEIVCELYGLILGQVWSCYDILNLNVAVKVDAYCADSAPSFIKDYNDTCDMLSFVTGGGITGKTLETDKPHLCLNVDNMTDNALLAALLPVSIKSECSRLTICLRSIDSTNHIYVFEFLWPQSRKYFLLFESLLLTLERCLPSFKFATATIDDDLCIVDVENPSRNGVGVRFFKILQGNRISQILDALKEGRKWEGETAPAFTKRKIGDLPHSNKEYKRVKQDNSDSNEERLLVVEFEEKISLFRISFSSKLAHLQKAINKEFNLVSSETYSLKYFDSCWVSVLDEEDMEECINFMRVYNSAYLHFRVESTT